MEVEESIEVWGQVAGEEAASPDIGVIPLSRESLAIRILLLVLSLLTIYTFVTIDYQGIDIVKATADTFSNFKIVFLQPNAHRLSLADAFYEVLTTSGLAFLTTLFGGVIALPLGLLSARNLAPKAVGNCIKSFVAFIRAVPTILWVLIFAVAAGLGSAAAVIGMTFHSVSYLTKAYSESFEDLDKGVIEALKAGGADWWQIVFQAVIPSSMTALLSWTFVRFEINFANAVAMGAAAGAAGVGFDLYMASGYYFDLREVGLITYIILAFAMALETISTRTKGKIKKKH